MKITTALFLIFSFFICFSQSIEELELILIEKLEKVHFEKKMSKSLDLNEDFKIILEKALQNKDAFTFPFDSLSNFMSTKKSPDDAFRIFNWNIQFADQQQHYECWILQKNLQKQFHFQILQYPS